MQQHDNQLTPREERVWRFHREGKDLEWIAKQFQVSPRIITTWLMEIRRKLQDGREGSKS